MQRKILLAISFIIFRCGLGYSQQFADKQTVAWQTSENSEIPSTNLLRERQGDIIIPFLFYQFPVQSIHAQFVITSSSFDPYKGKIVASDLKDFQDILQDQFVHSENGKFILNVKLLPLRSASGENLEKLKDFQYQISDVSTGANLGFDRKTLKKADFNAQSELATGTWYKIGIEKEGIFKMDAAFLTELGMDVSNIQLDKFRIFGQEGGMLSEVLAHDILDDMKELTIKVIDENSDNKLNGNDLIVFYAQGPNEWIYDKFDSQYVHETNFYSIANYYYINADGANGKRVAAQASNHGSTFEKNYDFYQHLLIHEKEEKNFLQSGRAWWGNSFKHNTIQELNFTVNNARTDMPFRLRHRITARSTQTSGYKVEANDSLILFGNIPYVSGDYESLYHAPPITQVAYARLKGDNIKLQYEYIKTTAEGDAWIDMIELAVPAALKYSGATLPVYLPDSRKYNNVRLQFSGTGFTTWMIQDPYSCMEKELQSENGFLYGTFNNAKKDLKLMCFKNGDLPKPLAIGEVKNQNLHGLASSTYVIVAHNNFMESANRLADFHRTYNKFSTIVVSTEQVFNEFSAGKKDPTAIRNFLKMLYDKGQQSGDPLKFVLLFGDGSYDYKDITKNNTNLVPCFQSRLSYSPTSSYSSDDYFAILEDFEGYYDLTGAKEGLDIGVGRIPASNQEEARIFVDKVVKYHETSSFGDWRNRLTFLADDEDGNRHILDNEIVTSFILSQKKEYNVNKIYLDAYEQVSFGSGQKYPEVNVDVNKSFEKGHLIFNYLGHGGSSGLAHERVITRGQILSWTNSEALPLVVTATCELSRFDDPAEKSPGELLMFSERGGAIALITTTRLVYLGNNSDLNEQVFDENIFTLHDGIKPTLGMVFQRTKNNSNKAINQRNFILLGDPAMRVAFPEYKVITTSINDSIVGQQSIDTFKAFEKIKITGAVTSNGSVVSDFNGFVYPTIFDKFSTFRTLANDLGSYPYNYKMQNSVLYRGKVSVINGLFSFQFIVPKDIAYQFGNGKISYYAENGSIDGHGFKDDFLIGGSGQKVTNDSKGPDIELFMDNAQFVFGGLTGSRPELIAKIFDENGVNTVGNGIGRDLLAIVDEGTANEQTIVLNDFYTSKLDSYQEGEIRYKMEELNEGKHTLKLKVWDVYNNSNEAYTEFIVSSDEDIALQHILNYPNPFTTHTTFHFDHNKVGQELDISVQIFTVAGNLVKTFNINEYAQSGHFQNIDWDGRDQYGDKLARGVYLYKIAVKSEDGSSTSDFQKLMLLN
jgi:hypothetical protein